MSDDVLLFLYRSFSIRCLRLWAYGHVVNDEVQLFRLYRLPPAPPALEDIRCECMVIAWLHGVEYGPVLVWNVGGGMWALSVYDPVCLDLACTPVPFLSVPGLFCPARTPVCLSV